MLSLSPVLLTVIMSSGFFPALVCDQIPAVYGKWEWHAPSGLSVPSFSLQLFGSCFVVALHSLPVLWAVLCVLALLPYPGVEQAVCPSLRALSALLPLCSRGLLPDTHFTSRAPPCFSQVSHWSSAGSAFHCLSWPHELMYGNAASPPAVWCRHLCRGHGQDRSALSFPVLLSDFGSSMHSAVAPALALVLPIVHISSSPIRLDLRSHFFRKPFLTSGICVQGSSCFLIFSASGFDFFILFFINRELSLGPVYARQVLCPC